MATTAIIRSIKDSGGSLTAEVTINEKHRDELAITQHPVERGAAITDHVYKLPATLTVQAGWSALYASGNKSSGSSGGILADANSALNQFSSILSGIVGSGATKQLSDALNTATGLASGSSASVIDQLHSHASAIAGQYNIPGVSTALSAAYQSLTQSADSSGTGDALSDLYLQLLDMQEAAELLEVQTGKRLYENMVIRALSVTTDQATENVLMVTIDLQEIILVDTLQTTMPPNANRADPAATSGVANTGTKSVGAPTGDVQVVAIVGQPVAP